MAIGGGGAVWYSKVTRDELTGTRLVEASELVKSTESNAQKEIGKTCAESRRAVLLDVACSLMLIKDVWGRMAFKMPMSTTLLAQLQKCRGIRRLL